MIIEEHRQKSLNYNLACLEQLSSIGEPLEHHHHLRLFCYRRIYLDGKFLYLTACENWVKYCFENYLSGKYRNIFLTKREAECAYSLSQGKSAKQIAKELNLSPRTVEAYIYNIKRKVGLPHKSNLIEICASELREFFEAHKLRG